MESPPAGRRVLITGGAGRLGRAIAAEFRREDAAVAISDVDSALLERAGARGELAGVALLLGDTSSAADVARIVVEAEDRIGPLDTLVTCAAVYPNRPVLAMDPADWDRVFAVNVRGAMLASAAVGRNWVERGTRGAMVHLSSGAGVSARRGAAAYCASKAALNMLVEVLALELGPYQIRVNAVAPGLVTDESIVAASPLAAGSPELSEYIEAQLRGTPLGRTGAPSDIAHAVTFLASERSAWTTGTVLDVTGGSHCGRAHLNFT